MENKSQIAPETILMILQHTGILMAIGVVVFIFAVTTFVQVFLNKELGGAGKAIWAILILVGGFFAFGLTSFIYAFIYYKAWAKLVPTFILLACIVSFGWFMKDLFAEILKSDQFQERLGQRHIEREAE